MENSKIRFGLVGCGVIAKKHLVALSRIENAQIAAVCDTSLDCAKKIGLEYNLPYYSNPHDMAMHEKFDVFSLLAPSGIHAKLILDLVKYNRHFVVEKPMALRIEDADQIIKECDESGSKIFVVQQNRFNLPIRKLREAIDQGRFGKMVLGTVRVRWCRDQNYYNAKPWRGTWALDGGVLTNQASHHIDMLVWMMGEVESVSVMTSTRLAKIEAEDTGVATIRFYSGALGIIEATTATRPKDLEGSISILGERGAVEIGGYYMNELKTWQFDETSPDDDDVFEKWGTNPNEFAWNHTEYLKDVIQSLQQGRRGLVEGLEGRKSLELINALYESAELNKTVSLRFRPRNCRLGMQS